MTTSQIHTISHEGQTLAIIIPNNYSCEGINFFTPDDFSQQLAYIKHPAGKQIVPHSHRPIDRTISYTQEVLIIKTGKVRVDFYDDQKLYLHSRILVSGDIILLASGGHGFEMLEESEFVEVKQGPYAGPEEKTRFGSIPESDVVIKGEG